MGWIVGHLACLHDAYLGHKLIQHYHDSLVCTHLHKVKLGMRTHPCIFTCLHELVTRT